MNVGIYIFDEVEILDFAGPFEVFYTAARVYSKSVSSAEKLFEVFTVAESGGTVKARGGLSILPGYAFDRHPKIDILVVPGGVVTAELNKPGVISWVSSQSNAAQLTASVCTGAFILGKAGLLDGRIVTTHWEDIDDLRAMFPEVTVKENARYIDQSDIVTSAGISAGTDMSLHLVARLAGEELAVKTARQMEYHWHRA
ncbi:MAG TPA: DJ-1/PfpI family protein [Gammaproteobacteria bacterium]